jgi:hypothetical protein
MKKHKRVAGYLKNMTNEDNRETAMPAPASAGGRGRRRLHLKINQAAAKTNWQT